MKRQFGRYVIADEVVDELGRGAFGRVYRAFDPNVNRYVAVKVLSSGSDPDMLSRFRDESKTAGKLEHENIVKVYDFDLQDGMPYLVMELLEGETLESLIRSRMVFGRPLQLLDEVQIMFQVAAGLQYAHAQNVIHRDIKPGNIMVLPNGTAKVMDFGIARMMDKGGTRLTRQGDIAGTILYMAPEQFKGCDADKRTDIFSYADVYYELLTGEHPFFATDPGTVMYRITAHDPPPIRERVPECPPLLEAMIQRLMAKDREIRPDRLEEVIFDTQPILQGLRQERAAALAGAIPALIEAGDRETARQAIRQVLELDPLNVLARRLRDQLLDESRRRTLRTRVEALAREGEEHVAARRFNEAVQCFERASALDRSDAPLQSRLGEVKLICDQVRKAARLLSEARSELQQGQLEAALAKSEEASRLDRDNQEAVEFGREVCTRIRDRRDADALLRAREHRSRGEYAEALEALDGIEGDSAAKIEAALLRALVERDRAEAELRRRRELFEAALAGFRQLLVSQRLDEALVSAEALSAEYPDQAEAADLVSEVRENLAARGRLEALGKITQAARSLVKEDRFEEALNTVEEGLHSYPGDTSLTRLRQVTAALAAAQKRAEQIARVIERTFSLASERRLDEALDVIDRAIAEFGNEIALAERKRDLELERVRAEYAAGLRKTLEQARGLLAGQQPGGAVELLEEAMFRFPGEPEIAALRDQARAARAAEEEREVVSQTLSEAAALELAGQFETALARVDAALAQYPGNADLPSLAGRLRQKLEEQGRSRMLASRVGRIEAAIHAGNWDLAEAEWQDARRVLPAEEALAQFPGAIQEGKHRAHMRSLQGRVEDSLNRQDVDDAERQLSAASEAFPEESVWQTLRSDCLRLRQYLESLASAENARGRKEYELAGRILTPLLAGAPDRCAARLLDEVNAARRAAEEEASRVEEERRRRADEGARRKRERAAIAKGRAQAAALVRKADYPAAIALLDRLAGEYPDAMEIRRDLDAAKLELQTRQREAEEQARLLREQALAARREEAAKLLRDGDPPGALALLDRMNLEFPDVIEIRQDRETIAGELDRQRREAEERTRRLREQAIAAGRQEADTLLSAGDALGAMALLDRLAEEYPEVSAIRRDREAAARTEERLRREAEDQARREREREVVAAGRAQAAALLREGNHQSAIALLIQLAAEYPENLGLQSDREAARRDWERQQREAEEETRRRREHSIATGRQEAAESLRNGDAPGAIAILDRLIADYPEAIEIRHDREAAVAEGERQRREAEERALRERERQAIQAGRAQAAALAGAGSHQAAIALLDQLAAQYPGDPQIREDRQVAWLAWEKLRSEAEEQARRERELAAILQGRGDAARFVQDGDYQAASALLDRLALQFPGNPDIEQDRKSAVEALERQHSEAEARARRALATFSASRREPGESAEPAVRTRKPLGRPVRKPHPGAGRPADDTSAPFSSGLRTGLGRADGGEPGAASDGRSTASEMTGLQNPGAPSRTHSGAESAPVPGTALSRLCHYAGHAILAVRNAIAVFLGKGDRSVIVPVLDPTAAAALGWIVQRHPGDLALLTARDELMRRPGRASASRDRLILLVAGIAVVVVLTSYLACRPAAARARASQAGVKPAPPAAAIVPGR